MPKINFDAGLRNERLRNSDRFTLPDAGVLVWTGMKPPLELKAARFEWRR